MMLNFEIADDAHYEGLELQVFDDPVHGRGMVVLLKRRQDHIDLVLDVTRGWTPRGLPPLMAAVTRVAPVFRTWPTTYRWSATITLGDQPMPRSRWQRKSKQRDQPYRRLTTARPR